MNIIVIYDDTVGKSEVIADIIGDKGFAEVVVKKRRLEEYYEEGLRTAFPDFLWKKVHSVFEYADIMKELERCNDDQARILHCFSNYLIADRKTAALSFEKLWYIDEEMGIFENKNIAGAMFPSVSDYIRFCKNIISGQNVRDMIKEMKNSFEIEGLIDIGAIDNFIQCITGNFDSRYFNSLKGNKYTLVKSSSNKKKIKAEYCFYHLLPEDMKFWFVLPFNYREEADSASYTMERLYMADLSTKWVHGSMSETEFEDLMDTYFFFFRSRHAKPCTEEEYRKISDALYTDKINNRIAELKEMPEYQTIQKLLEISGDAGLDKLVRKYFTLKERLENRKETKKELVIGHGDPCFSNALYNKTTRMLKFIDPKGALTEAELWTNAYYDVAKLSHSVCGRYDFFNNALFDIKVDETFSYNLEIPFDNSRYVEIFKRKAEENGFDYQLIRIYEASLFLSMLPLHMDNPHKVFGFILNVKNILEEIEKDVS